MAEPPALEVDPADALFDEPLRLRVQGLRPGEPVELRTETDDELGRTWSARARFEADEHGCVDLSRLAPVDGTYRGVEPDGLLWSLSLPVDAKPIPFTREDVVAPLRVRLESSLPGLEPVELTRHFLAPGVTREPVRKRGLVGSFFRPPGSDPTPALLVIGGSDGGLHEHYAAVLASRGFATLALAYFRCESLPTELAEIPLEYFESALAWLAEREEVRADALGVMGQSRGGELALLLAATYPQLRAVVGYAASGLVHAGLGDPSAGPRSAWTLDRKPLPFVSPDRTAIDPTPPLRLAASFAAGLRDRQAVSRAEIAVEKIRGAVLLFSGEADALWPAPDLAEIAVARLARHDFPHPFEHVRYPGAGHGIRLPNLPTSLTQMLHPVAGFVIELGGSPAANAHASRDAWNRVLTFLRANLA